MIDLSNSKKVKDSIHGFFEITQLYHPTGVFGEESHDLVYAFDNLNSTKFTPILLKEWFCLVKKNGYLIIDYRPNKICDWQKLEKNMWWLLKNKYEILYHGLVDDEKTEDLTGEKIKLFISYHENYYTKGLEKNTLLPKAIQTRTYPTEKEKYLRFICKKTSSMKIEGDSIDNWTFGIITSGARRDWIEDIIKSIRQQKIPNYEIIICGTYFNRGEADVRYIPFNKRDDLGWITKKKNIIAHEAKYQNLCVLHDRIILDNKWFEGMKKWGNCFETLAVPQLFVETKERFGDWVCNSNFRIKTVNKLFSIRCGYMEYKDWDNYIPGYAAVTIIKKSIFEKYGFDETLYWNENDDLLLHQDLSSRGYLLRMNPDAVTYSRTKSVFDLKWRFVFDPLKLGKLKNVGFFQYGLFYVLQLLGIKKNNKALGILKSFIKRHKRIKTHKDNK